MQGARKSAWDAIYRMTRRIPRGRVMTYGQIATLLESRTSARAVGWALHGCPEDVPWQRVVNAAGACSTERIPDLPPGLQQALLEAEGVEFASNGKLDLSRYRWVPPEHRAAARTGKGRGNPATRRRPSRSGASRP